jgi:hypothetical protein
MTPTPCQGIVTNDQANIAPMQQALSLIAQLVPAEATENEPANEPDDEG